MNYEGVILVVGFPLQINFHICSLWTDSLEKKNENGDYSLDPLQIFQISQSKDYFIVNRKSVSCLKLVVKRFLPSLHKLISDSLGLLRIYGFCFKDVWTLEGICGFCVICLRFPCSEESLLGPWWLVCCSCGNFPGDRGVQVTGKK